MKGIPGELLQETFGRFSNEIYREFADELLDVTQKKKLLKGSHKHILEKQSVENTAKESGRNSA